MKSYLTRLIAFFLTSMLLLGTMPVYAAETSFADVSDHWASWYIESLAEKAIVAGMDDGLFHPDLTVTTSEFVTLVLKAVLEI